MKQTTYIVTAIEHDEIEPVKIPEQVKAETPQQSQSGMVTERPIGALCFLPKSIHRLAKNYARDRDTTAKRFFLETMLLGLKQQGIINDEQYKEALRLPDEYGWKGRNRVSSQ